MSGLRDPGWVTAAAMALLLVLAHVLPADARKFQMSGTWMMRRGGHFVPLQYASPPTPAVHASMGNWTSNPAPDPDQIIQGAGGVSVDTMGVPNPAVRVPRHRFVGEYSRVLPLGGTLSVQITTMLAIDGPYSSATLHAAGGPGNLTWCPANPACTAAAPLPSGVTGRVVYVAGPNRFGGTMQMGLRGGGRIALRVAPGLVGHIPVWGSGSAPRRLAVGGGANDAPSIEVVKLAAAVITAPIGGVPAQGMLITMPGPVVGMAPSIPTPMGGMAGQFTTNWGFGHTTGTVIVQQDFGSGGDDFFTVMGSDLRTPSGAGNLSLVAGGLTVRNTAFGAEIAGLFDRIWITFGPPVPSLSPAGFAAGGALILLAAGYAGSRRLSSGSS